MPCREGRATVRWVLPPDDSRKVWIASSFVKGFGSWQSPLHTLRQAGTDAARILMTLYLYEDMPTYGGIDPTTAIYRDYETEAIYTQQTMPWLFHTSQGTESVKMAFCSDRLDIHENANGEIHEFWRAFKKLVDRGFIYECLTVFTGVKINDDMCLLYPLHTFNKHGHPPKGEESLSGKMNRVADTFGLSASDSTGRFYGKFSFIADDDDVQAVGIYRLRFRNTNKAFDDVLHGWQGIQDSHRHWSEKADQWIQQIRDKQKMADSGC
ncbi:hypothetical protein [Tichowtungia aerotolerans]|uniref:Uncharacterized protein n=1 Tax=Tichowtungia aerotolerans TaxID=2697043 RepID=A0A6P1M8B8_9BACT|nr:hypothetical protein [Tichowtungia aerotolerans]QHI68764.1 hypothetical protein GT409_04640 [Tichowtungia aerotolerans]